eukprot:SAG25_NODE_570_length_6860_cov_10.441799_2_plen_70_part_00
MRGPTDAALCTRIYLRLSCFSVFPLLRRNTGFGSSYLPLCSLIALPMNPGHHVRNTTHVSLFLFLAMCF